MKANKIWRITDQIYDTIETGLWALLVAGLIFFSAFVAPTLPTYWAQAEVTRIQQIAAENEYYCEQLGMKPGTPKHDQCLIYLGEFRQKVENRLADDLEF
jgi:hypothetical protein